jgi:hypothetical protein
MGETARTSGLTHLFSGRRASLGAAGPPRRTVRDVRRSRTLLT